MKVLVSDTLAEAGINILKNSKNIEVDVRIGLSSKELSKIISVYHGLVIRSSTKVTESLLKKADKLKVIGRAGIGLDNVDIEIATKRGIIVMNTPTGNVVTTAEHAIAMMLSLTRKIPLGTSTLKEGFWNKKKLQGREVYNKILGVVGFGKIGEVVADRASGLKMNVCVYDPIVSNDKIEVLGYESVTLDDLYAKSDYITVHVPRMRDTIGMFDSLAFNKMKTGVMIINCSRGGIVNESDLYDAIVSGKVFGAALDVFEKEPPGKNKLLELDQVICTPHLGASTLEAQTNVSVMVAEQIVEYLENGNLINAVNA